MRTVLVIDDDLASCRVVAAALRHEPYELVLATDGAGGLARCAELRPDLVLLEVGVAGPGGAAGGGLEVLARLRALAPALPVIVVAARPEVRTAVRATQLGAADYLSKPIAPDELLLAIRRELARGAPGRPTPPPDPLADMLGVSAAARALAAQVGALATTDVAVLLVGETGTGKQVIAHALHRHGARQAGPFLAVDAGAVPPPLLEAELFGSADPGGGPPRDGLVHRARGGTLFLDDVGALPHAIQARLLRVLERRPDGSAAPPEVRVLAATRAELARGDGPGQVRSELYFRLAQATLHLPPLRDRAEDVPHLARRVLRDLRRALGRPAADLTDDALALLATHPWPGNIRELENVLRDAVLHAGEAAITAADLAPRLRPVAPPATDAAPGASQELRSLRETAEIAARDAEARAITEALRLTRGNKSQAAKLLQTDYKTLHLKMKALGLDARDFTA